MKVIAPLAIRKLRAEMELKNLSLRAVAEAAEVNYSIASQVLSGRLIHPRALAKIRAVIKATRSPEEASLAA